MAILNHFGALIVEEHENLEYKRVVIGNMKTSYVTLRPKLGPVDVYRTFDTDILKKGSIWLVDYEFPERFVRQKLLK